MGIKVDLCLEALTCFGLAITCVFANFSVFFTIIVVVSLNDEEDDSADAENEVSSNSSYHPFKVIVSGSPSRNVDLTAASKRRRQHQEAPTSKTTLVTEVVNFILFVLI